MWSTLRTLFVGKNRKKNWNGESNENGVNVRRVLRGPNVSQSYKHDVDGRTDWRALFRARAQLSIMRLEWVRAATAQIHRDFTASVVIGDGDWGEGSREGE